MKWYFACNDKSENFYPLIKGAVNSAIANTSLEPNFIYDGSENELTQWLRARGVNIIFHKSSIFDALENFYRKEDLHIPSGAFLRCDIPLIETQEEYVLYTDCDVLFLKDFDYKNLSKPEYFSCSTQFKRNDFVHFNTGIMYMNIKNLRKDIDKFFEFIKNNLGVLKTFDQDAYQIYYSGKNTKLPIKYNHKPYWGIDSNAVILHFHGGKPTDFKSDESVKNLCGIYYDLYKKNPKSYRYYLQMFQKYNNEIPYDENALSKLDSGIYPIIKYQRNSLIVRLKNRLQKELKKVLLKFFNKK